MTELNNTQNIEKTLLITYCFLDNFIKTEIQMIYPSLELYKADQNKPPRKRHRLNLSEAVLGIFRYYTGKRNWKDTYLYISNISQ